MQTGNGQLVNRKAHLIFQSNKIPLKLQNAQKLSVIILLFQVQYKPRTLSNRMQLLNIKSKIERFPSFNICMYD